MILLNKGEGIVVMCNIGEYYLGITHCSNKKHNLFSVSEKNVTKLCDNIWKFCDANEELFDDI